MTPELAQALVRLLPRLRGLARHLLPAWVRAKLDEDDVVNSCLKSFLRDQGAHPRPEIALDEDGLFNLLAAMLRSKSCDKLRYYRRQCRDVALEVPLDDDPAGREAQAEREVADVCQRLLHLLPEKHGLRDVVILHDLEGMTFEAIASRLGMSRPTAQRRYREAIRRLRESYEADQTGTSPGEGP